MKNRKGFTIVELVIVIAVIAILAAVLIPTFTTVTKNAKISAAQSQAKNGLDQIIALTGGQMTEKTVFAVSDDDDFKAEYWFAFEKNALKQIDPDKVDRTVYPTKASKSETTGEEPNQVTVTTYTYLVYVTADCFGTDSDAKTAARNAAKGMIEDVAGLAEGSWNLNDTAVGNYYVWTYTVSATDVREFHVYYASEIQETMVVFIANS